jgi:hypothetical protein
MFVLPSSSCSDAVKRTGGCMVNKPRRLGTAWEGEVKSYLQSHGFPEAEREDFSSPLGDIRHTPATLECKNCNSITLGPWMVQVKKSDAKTKRNLPIIVAKKRNAAAKEAYFITDLEHGAILMKALEICRERDLL